MTENEDDKRVQALLAKVQEMEDEKEEQTISKLKSVLKKPARIDAIQKAYKAHLKRKPSLKELKHHIFSRIPDEDIDEMIQNSLEAQNIKKRGDSGGVSFDMITDMIAIGETPPPESFKELQKEFQLFISLNSEKPTYTALVESEWFQFNKPLLQPELVVQACELIKKALAEEKKIFLQCEIGGPKSLAVLAFYMVTKEGKKFEESIKEINEKRPLCTLEMSMLSIDNILQIYDSLKE